MIKILIFKFFNRIFTYRNSNENTFRSAISFLCKENTGNKAQGDRYLIGCLPQEARENDTDCFICQLKIILSQVKNRRKKWGSPTWLLSYRI